jgi:flagellar hook-basal body complex protein FliE
MIGGVGLFDQPFSTGRAGSAAGSFGASKATDGVQETSFADLLAAAANRTVDTLNNAESISVQALQGKADTREVVDAVMSAEQSLQTAIAIRDKIVSAYLDISRMSI